MFLKWDSSKVLLLPKDLKDLEPVLEHAGNLFDTYNFPFQSPCFNWQQPSPCSTNFARHRRSEAHVKPRLLFITCSQPSSERKAN